MASKNNYKLACQKQKVQIEELETQVLTLKKRLDTLRKAKNQTILKTEIVSRDLAEPKFGGYVGSDSDDTRFKFSVGNDCSPTKSVHLDHEMCAYKIKLPAATETRDVGSNTVAPEKDTESEYLLDPQPKRYQRKRVRDNWAQCKVYRENKFVQVRTITSCMCEGNSPTASSSSSANNTNPGAKQFVNLPCISANNTAAVSNPDPGPIKSRPLSRLKTNEFISVDDHDKEVKALEIAYKLEREKYISAGKKETKTLKDTVETLSRSLKEQMEQNNKKLAGSGSVFHLYAEEKCRLDDQIRHLNSENTKLKNKVAKLTANLRTLEEESKEAEASIRPHFMDTWDEQYRAWISKTENKMTFLRDSNELMQTFIIKNAKHLPFGATDSLKIFDEYGEKVSVFQ